MFLGYIFILEALGLGSWYFLYSSFDYWETFAEWK